MEWIYKHIEEYIDDHKDTLDVDNPRDFIDLFMIKEKEDNDNPTFPRKTFTLFAVSDVFTFFLTAFRCWYLTKLNDKLQLLVLTYIEGQTPFCRYGCFLVNPSIFINQNIDLHNASLYYVHI